MENPRPEKVAVVEEVKSRLSDADAAVLTDYRGIDVPGMATLRTALREAGAEYQIYKNTLVRFAARDLGLEIEEMLVGPTAIAFIRRDSDGDPVLMAKALREFAKTNPNLEVKGGLLGDRPLTAADVDQLAQLAPRDELLSRLAGTAWRPRWCSSPACCRPCPATSPTASRPSSTSRAACPLRLSPSPTATVEDARPTRRRRATPRTPRQTRPPPRRRPSPRPTSPLPETRPPRRGTRPRSPAEAEAAVVETETEAPADDAEADDTAADVATDETDVAAAEAAADDTAAEDAATTEES